MTDELLELDEPVIELPSDVAPEPTVEPDPVPTAPPVEVIPVDDFLDRLAELFGSKDSAPEQSEELPAEDLEESAAAIDGDIDIPAVEPDPVIDLVKQVLDNLIDLGKIEKHLDKIEDDTGELKEDTNEIQLDMVRVAQTLDHPALTTSFADYTVTEALLLFLLLAVFVSACARMLKGGFSWLRS